MNAHVAFCAERQDQSGSKHGPESMEGIKSREKHV